MGKGINRRIFGVIGSAISDYELIQDGDRILLGISGGKDSLFMAWALADIRRRAPVEFSLEAVTIDPGGPWKFDEAAIDSIHRFLSVIGVPYHVVTSNIARVVIRGHGRKTPCSLCANLRRGYLHQAANDLGMSKVALGHHLDDAIETLLLNMFYQGNLRCFQPKTYLSRRNIEVIRPMVYVEEPWIAKASSKLGLPVTPPTCGFSGNTSRQHMKGLVSGLSENIPGLRRQMRNVFKSLWR